MRRGYQAGARFVAVLAVFSLSMNLALAGQFRVVTYNILADSGGVTEPRSGMGTVLEGIGDENVNSVTRPVDVLSLQETTSNTTTVQPLLDILNNIYGANTYAMSPYQAKVNGSATSGNGPNALVYNATTLQLVASVGIGTPSSSGAPRQPVRYELRPVGADASKDFYVYVSHCKAGTRSSDMDRRNIEAQLLRSDAATLPAGARILYTGDFNLTASSEPFYQTLTAAGVGQAFDPLNRPGDWDNGASFVDIMTYGARGLHYRDDFICITQNVRDDGTGLQYLAGSYHTFGVNGSLGIGDPINSSSNTALAGLPNRSPVLQALYTASDHLPVVADFEINTAPPTIVLSTTTLEHNMWRGTDLPVDLLYVSNGTAGTTLNYTISSSATWLDISPNSGSNNGEQPDTIAVSYNTSALPLGTTTTSIVVTDAAASNSPQSVSVTLHVYTPGDFDHDSDVDCTDFGHLQTCFTVPGEQPAAGCTDADLNLDDAVNELDADVFINCSGGPAQPPGC